MWRSVAIGVVLAGLLAGCSWGGGNEAASQPSVEQVTGLVERLGATLPNGGKLTDVHCTVRGQVATCDAGYQWDSGNSFSVGAARFRFVRHGHSWRPLCKGGETPSSDPFCALP